MHRKITSDDVEGYASHLPKEEVNLNKEEDIVYKGGVLTQAKGKAVFKLMTQVSQSIKYTCLLCGLKVHVNRCMCIQ